VIKEDQKHACGSTAVDRNNRSVQKATVYQLALNNRAITALPDPPHKAIDEKAIKYIEKLYTE
jgi:hypothetical protein